MKDKKYPIYTVIMRGYTLQQADAIVEVMCEFNDYFAVEVTLNTDDAYTIIKHLTNKYGNIISIGAGTVRTLKQAKQAVDAGARFLLGPHMFTKDMLEFCKEQAVLAIPSALTPSEMNQMMQQGADIVKIFPASVVGPEFFKDIKGPFGKLPLMAVGGINQNNAIEYFENGASYLGIGSGMFTKNSLASLDKQAFKDSFERLISLVKG